MTSPTITRFAPSPTGFLHLGHAYSAFFSEKEARANNGIFLIRIEDIDKDRCSPKFENEILHDLAWLQLNWNDPIRRQSNHMDDYINALNKLKRLNLIYPCTLTRKELSEALSAPHFNLSEFDKQKAPVETYQYISNSETERRLKSNTPHALRLHMKSALKLAGNMTWYDKEAGVQKAEPEIFGDVVLARKDIPTSYHLSVTVDDAIQGITTITRGEDLFKVTHIHRLLQELLGLPTPNYHHHKIITDANGNRLAKRNKANTINALRELGTTPEEIRDSLGFT